MYRQGDVLLIPLSPCPDLGDAEPIPAEQGRLIVAQGEATGHAHTVSAQDAVLVRLPDGRVVLDVLRPTGFMHQVHDTIPLEVRSYEVVGQREYSLEAIRRVSD